MNILKPILQGCRLAHSEMRDAIWVRMEGWKVADSLINTLTNN